MHPQARFDHVLYAQPVKHVSWEESPHLAQAFIKLSKAQGLVAPELHCYRQKLNGLLPNQDTWL